MLVLIKIKVRNNKLLINVITFQYIYKFKYNFSNCKFT